MLNIIVAVFFLGLAFGSYRTWRRSANWTDWWIAVLYCAFPLSQVWRYLNNAYFYAPPAVDLVIGIVVFGMILVLLALVVKRGLAELRGGVHRA